MLVSSSLPHALSDLKGMTGTLECSAHRGQGFGIVDIFNVAEWGHFVLLYLRDSAVALRTKKAPLVLDSESL